MKGMFTLVAVVVIVSVIAVAATGALSNYSKNSDSAAGGEVQLEDAHVRIIETGLMEFTFETNKPLGNAEIQFRYDNHASPYYKATDMEPMGMNGSNYVYRKEVILSSGGDTYYVAYTNLDSNHTQVLKAYWV